MMGFPENPGNGSPRRADGPAWIDSHCHFAHEQPPADADRVWQRARDAGVSDAVLVGVDIADSTAMVAYVQGRPGLVASVGVHPNSAESTPLTDSPRIAELLGRPGVVALGETGLDAYRKRACRSHQEDWFRWHLETALDHDLPVILHLRDTYREAAELLAPYVRRGVRAVVHCFSGGPEDLVPYREWGFPISFSGILTYPSAEAVRAAARSVPLEQCLVETDAPWLAPIPHRGQRNEPAHVIHTGRVLARVKECDAAEVARVTSANARRFFRLDQNRL